MNQNKSKSRFLASTLHEIRTPIQTIIGTLDLLGDTNLDKEQLEYVRQIQFSADVLLTLANDVLDFTKLQSGKFKIENIPFNPVLIPEMVTDLISIEAHNRGLELVTDINYSLPQQMYGDPNRIQQVLLNLIKNAVKFTPSGYIRVSLDYTKDKKSILFEVQDSGIGIPEEKQSQIFSEFYQVDASTTRKYGGTGLGLSICSKLIAQMKGKIGVKQNPKGGSIFWFSIPIDEQTLKETKHQKKNINTVNQKADEKILIVDDNKIALKSMKDKLLSLGFTNVKTAQSGPDALTTLEKATLTNKPFTICFIDMIMPKMDGWRLSAEINANHHINDAKLYLVVPEGQMGGEAKMKMLDWFNGYLYKPIKRTKLISIMNEACQAQLDLEVIEGDSNPELLKTENTPTLSPDKIAAGLTCLIAEDHPINQKLLKIFVENFGSSVITADDGQMAIDAVKASEHIDIIFMDIQMPVKTGIEAAKEIRRNGYKGIIIACTANADKDDNNEYLKNGMDDVLIKPFKKIQIQETFEKWLPNLEILDELPAAADDSTKQDSGWNITELMESVSNDKVLALELVTHFIEQTKSLLLKAREALTSNNYKSLSRIARSLKSSAFTVYATQLFKLAEELEIAAKANDFERATENMNQFTCQFSALNDIAQEQTSTWQSKKA